MDGLRDLVAACREGRAPYQSLVDRVPYANFLGIEITARGEELTFVLPQRDTNLGNPTLPALHGGAVAGFMEQAAIIFLLLEMGEPRVPKTIDFTIDYLRAGLPRDAYARARVNRSGRRYASVHVEGWQDNRARPFAQATGHFLMPDRARA